MESLCERVDIGWLSWLWWCRLWWTKRSIRWLDRIGSWKGWMSPMVSPITSLPYGSGFLEDFGTDIFVASSPIGLPSPDLLVRL